MPKTSVGVPFNMPRLGTQPARALPNRRSAFCASSTSASGCTCLGHWRPDRSAMKSRAAGQAFLPRHRIQARRPWRPAPDPVEGLGQV